MIAIIPWDYSCWIPYYRVMAVDIVGPLPESNRENSYIMVVGDYFIRWMEAFPIPNQEAATIAEKLIDEMFLWLSIPE